MNPKVRDSLDNSYAQDLTCSICGQKTLRVVHLAAYPDYVSCTNCGSAFVVEDGGERVMYGKIPAQYSETRHFALQQWVWPEAIARKSATERSSGSGTDGPPRAQDLPAPARPVTPPAPPEPEPTAELDARDTPKTTPGFPEAPAVAEPAESMADLAPVSPSSPTAPLQTAGTAESELRSAFGQAPAADSESQAEPSLGDEEDLLDSLWGDMPQAAGTSASGPPPLPDWAAGLPDEPELTPEGDVQADAATSSRLHDWVAQQPYESRPKAAADKTADALQDALPSSVAPFEAGDWTGEDFASPTVMDEPGAGSSDDASAAAPLITPAGAQPDSTLDEGAKKEMVQAYWGGIHGPAKPAEEPAPAEPGAASEHHEPPPGQRFRVVLKGSNPRFPTEACAHCQYQPAPARIPVVASLTKSGPGDRQIGTLRIPVCADCHQRAAARSEEQQTSRLQAHLIGVLSALILVVCGLGFSLINLKDNLGAALAGLVVLAVLGYTVPAVPLLLRASRLPIPADAGYVGTTLRVPGDTEATETAYEWRSQGYARRFQDANAKIAVSEVTKVRDFED